MAQPGCICETGQQHRSFWQLRRRHNGRSRDEELLDVARKAIPNHRAGRAVVRGAAIQRVQHHQPGHSEYSDYKLVLRTYYQYTIRRAGGSSNNSDDAAADLLTNVPGALLRLVHGRAPQGLRVRLEARRRQPWYLGAIVPDAKLDRVGMKGILFKFPELLRA